MRVSICCSVLNQSELLRDMIANVREQVFQGWELILVDDGSTEDIQKVVNEFNDARIKLTKFPKNLGVPHGMNWALQHSGGEFIQPLSTDERLDKFKLMWQVGFFDEHPEVEGLWGIPQNGPMGQRNEFEQYALKAHNRSNEAWVRTLVNLESIPIGGASMLWRRKVLEDVGYFNPEFFTTSDLEWFVRFFRNGHKGLVLPYRWAIEVERKDQPLRATVSPERFQADMKKIRETYPVKPPKVMSKITVAIPCKNMAQWIGATLDSIQAQTWKEWEVMVWDDGSTDNLNEVLVKYPFVKFYRTEESIGANAAQNQMLARCETPFFCVLAADDTLDPMHLERHIAEFARDPWLEFVACQTDFIDKDGKKHEDKTHGFHQIEKAGNKTRDQWLFRLRYGNVYFGAGVYRTGALKDLGGWDTTVGCLGDYDMYLKLLQRENIHVIEENLVHTRIHDNNQSILKVRQERMDLRTNYKKIKDRYYIPRMKVVIATPFYEMKGYSPYIVSMNQVVRLLTMLGIEHEFMEVSGDSYVDRAKNTIMTKFLEDPEATDLFMIDSDMQWDPPAVIKLLQFPHEVVVGSYPQKNKWGTFTGSAISQEENGKRHPIGQMLPDGNALLMSDYLSGGFVRIKRSALEKFRDHYKDKVYYDPSADPADPERLYTEFCTCELGPGPNGQPLRWGEDRVFGKRLKAIGIDCWIYPNINFSHYGVKGWAGNFDQSLRGLAKDQEPNVQKVN